MQLTSEHIVAALLLVGLAQLTAAEGLTPPEVAPTSRTSTGAVGTYSRAGGAPQPRPPIKNPIDRLSFEKMRERGIAPSEICSDSIFLRRVFLDCIGTFPSVDQSREFLSSRDPQKRAKLIEWLLERPEFAEYWTMKWGDLLRIESEYPVRLWPKAAGTYQRWVKESIAKNKPYDQFVRDLVLSSGSNFRDGASNYYRAVAHRDPQTFADTTSLLFLGKRIGCVRCHARPNEKATLDDELALAAVFSKVAFKQTSEWKEEIVYLDLDATFKDPRSGKVVAPRLPNGRVLQVASDEDPRVKFAAWLTSPQNLDFSCNEVNRIWFWLMGRGIVQEPDDFRESNPPSNPELLDYLAAELIKSKFDTKHIYRLILNSSTYQLSGRVGPRNAEDEALFSHHLTRRLDAEVLLDAISQVTETTEMYLNTTPAPFERLKDFRAIDIGDGSTPSAWLQLFGRPSRDTPYQSERCSRLNVRQVMNTLNSSDIERKITASGRIKRLLQTKANDRQIIEEFYLAALSRYPTAQETQVLVKYLQHDKTAHFKSVQDVLWAIVNSREFLFNQ